MRVSGVSPPVAPNFERQPTLSQLQDYRITDVQVAAVSLVFRDSTWLRSSSNVDSKIQNELLDEAFTTRRRAR